MICPEELAVLVNTLAIAIAQDKSIEELNILAAVLVQLGDTLITISVQRDNIQACLEAKRIMIMKKLKRTYKHLIISSFYFNCKIFNEIF